MIELQRTDKGRYDLTGLDPRSFIRAFKRIHKEKAAKRRKSKRLLTPHVIKNKALEDIIATGRRRNSGLYLTTEELKSFEKRRGELREQLDPKTAGITYAQLISLSQDIDIKRAHNNVTDGRGIKNATPIAIRHNVLEVRVTASEASHDQFHLVSIRFEEWDSMVTDVTEDNRQNQKLVRQLCAGRVSVNCNCGRHQYWYRYIATAGNFALAPPKEYAYPKEKNPKLAGAGCKHVIHTITRLQSPAWQVRVLKSLIQASKSTAYADDKRRSTEHFTDAEQKELNKNRRSKTDVQAARRQWQIYQRRQQALGEKIAKEDAMIASLRNQLSRKKKMTDGQRKKAIALQQKLSDEKAKNELLTQQLKDQAMIRLQSMVDGMVMAGMSQKDAQAKALQMIKNGK